MKLALNALLSTCGVTVCFKNDGGIYTNCICKAYWTICEIRHCTNIDKIVWHNIKSVVIMYHEFYKYLNTIFNFVLKFKRIEALRLLNPRIRQYYLYAISKKFFKHKLLKFITADYEYNIIVEHDIVFIL